MQKINMRLASLFGRVLGEWKPFPWGLVGVWIELKPFAYICHGWEGGHTYGGIFKYDLFIVPRKCLFSQLWEDQSSKPKGSIKQQNKQWVLWQESGQGASFITVIWQWGLESVPHLCDTGSGEVREHLLAHHYSISEHFWDARGPSQMSLVSG